MSRFNEYLEKTNFFKDANADMRERQGNRFGATGRPKRPIKKEDVDFEKRMIEKDKNVCPECGGAGRIKDREFSDEDHTRMKNCEVCKGTGLAHEDK